MSALRVGPYRLGKTLGVGSFSKVKLAVHEATGEKVAIKILNRRKLKDMAMGTKVRREIDILRLFRHPHIIRLYEVIDTPTDIFSVMEYVSGGEMFDYIVSQGRLEEGAARKVFQQITAGVEYCHVHMVVHRDLKPENILLDERYNVKIADFGLSNMIRDGHFLKTSCGSPNYAAPEVISGNLYAGPEVDVWSCGVILYAILCGSLPFDDENIRNLFRKIKGGIYNIPSYVSPDARDLLSRMLVVNPIRRIKVAQIREHPWFKQHIPRYLALSAVQHIRIHRGVDRVAIDEVERMGYDRDRVEEALSMGPLLLTSKRYAHLVELRQMAVAYSLLRDKRLRAAQDVDNEEVEEQKHREEEEAAAKSQRAVLPGPGELDPSHSLTAGTEAQSPQSKTSDKEQTSSGNSASSAAATSSGAAGGRPGSASVSKTSRRWYLGKWSRLEPHRIMLELFRVLRTLGCDWRIISPFRIRARYVYHPGASTNPPTENNSSATSPASSPATTVHSYGQAAQPKMVKVGLQLFRARYLHVLDVHKIHGELFTFLDLCARIMTNLHIGNSDSSKSGGSSGDQGHTRSGSSGHSLSLHSQYGR